jgi:hypothetical protein
MKKKLQMELTNKSESEVFKRIDILIFYHISHGLKKLSAQLLSVKLPL